MTVRAPQRCWYTTAEFDGDGIRKLRDLLDSIEAADGEEAT